MALCTHGQVIGGSGASAGLAMAAPYTVCECCQQAEYYVDMFMDSVERSGRRLSYERSWTKGLCAKCGHYTETGKPF